jgi:hypothetical protein
MNPYAWQDFSEIIPGNDETEILGGWYTYTEKRHYFEVVTLGVDGRVYATKDDGSRERVSDPDIFMRIPQP